MVAHVHKVQTLYDIIRYFMGPKSLIVGCGVNIMLTFVVFNEYKMCPQMFLFKFIQKIEIVPLTRVGNRICNGGWDFVGTLDYLLIIINGLIVF